MQNLYLIPNQFPELLFIAFTDKTISRLKHAFSFDKVTIHISGNTILLTQEIQCGDDDFIQSHQFINTIENILSIHDIDPIEFKFRNITTPEGSHFYYHLITINP